MVSSSKGLVSPQNHPLLRRLGSYTKTPLSTKHHLKIQCYIKHLGDAPHRHLIPFRGVPVGLPLLYPDGFGRLSSELALRALFGLGEHLPVRDAIGRGEFEQPPDLVTVLPLMREQLATDRQQIPMAIE